MKYDDKNIFAKILRGEIPCNKVYENNNSLFFYDINPQAKIHVLGIPKVKCIDLTDFALNSNSQVGHWSSTENTFNSEQAIVFSFYNDDNSNRSKHDTTWHYLRCVRKE